MKTQESSEDRTADAHWQTGRVTEIRRHTERVKSFFIEPALPVDFIAGQHANLRLTAEDGYSAIRSYSIASAPERKDGFEVAIERLHHGEVSPFFHDTVVVGDEIEFRAPLGGHFIWSHTDGGPLLLIAGGSGVVPMVAMIRHREASGSTVPTVLLLSARNWDDVPFRDELTGLQAKKTGFSLALALTRESARGLCDYGRRIDEPMLAEVLRRLPSLPTRVFVCGSNGFVNNAADAAVALNISPGAISAERYGV
jgi:ferredoxin-NADP reductase